MFSVVSFSPGVSPPRKPRSTQGKAPAHPQGTPGGWEAQGRPRGRGGSCFKPHGAVALVVGPSTSSRCRRRCVLSDARMIPKGTLLTRHSLTPGLSTPAAGLSRVRAQRKRGTVPFLLPGAVPSTTGPCLPVHAWPRSPARRQTRHDDRSVLFLQCSISQRSFQHPPTPALNCTPCCCRSSRTCSRCHFAR